jgi:flagellar hook assembly protein FlgD
LEIYNILGQGVKSFDFENYNTGLHLFQWDGTNYYGEMVSSGVYIIFLEQSGKVAKRKMLVIR